LSIHRGRFLSLAASFDIQPPSNRAFLDNDIPATHFEAEMSERRNRVTSHSGNHLRAPAASPEAARQEAGKQVTLSTNFATIAVAPTTKSVIRGAIFTNVGTQWLAGDLECPPCANPKPVRGTTPNQARNNQGRRW
jgi:hypothetical protein